MCAAGNSSDPLATLLAQETSENGFPRDLNVACLFSFRSQTALRESDVVLLNGGGPCCADVAGR